MASLLGIVMVVVLIPVAEGRNLTTNVVELPPATEALGAVVTANSPAFPPEKLIVPMVKVVAPVFLMVYVLVIGVLTKVSPKIVQLFVEVNVPLSGITVAFPRISISWAKPKSIPVPRIEKL